MSELVVYTVDDGVARIALNRLEASNAVDRPTAQALHASVTRAATDDAVRSVLFTGNGKRFCVAVRSSSTSR